MAEFGVKVVALVLPFECHAVFSLVDRLESDYGVLSRIFFAGWLQRRIQVGVLVVRINRLLDEIVDDFFLIWLTHTLRRRAAKNVVASKSYSWFLAKSVAALKLASVSLDIHTTHVYFDIFAHILLRLSLFCTADTEFCSYFSFLKLVLVDVYLFSLVFLALGFTLCLVVTHDEPTGDRQVLSAILLQSHQESQVRHIF